MVPSHLPRWPPLRTRTWNCNLVPADHQITFLPFSTHPASPGMRDSPLSASLGFPVGVSFGGQERCLRNCKGKQKRSWVRANFDDVASNVRRPLRSSPALSCCQIEANGEKLPEHQTLSDDVAGGAASGAADGMLIGPRAPFINLERKPIHTLSGAPFSVLSVLIRHVHAEAEDLCGYLAKYPSSSVPDGTVCMYLRIYLAPPSSIHSSPICPHLPPNP